MSSPVINLSVYSKKLVNNLGSPTTVPDLFYGDTPVFNLFPVTPQDANPNHGYNSSDLTGTTLGIFLSDTPNATSPPTPFAFTTALAWNAALKCFSGAVDLTQLTTKTFIGANAFKVATIQFAVLDGTGSQNTLLQTTVPVNAAVNAVVPAAAQPGQQVLTVAQALAMFVLTGFVPGKRIDFQSDDGSKKKTLTLGNDGSWTGL